MFSNAPDPRFLSLLNTAYQPPSPPAKVGQGGRQIWEFQPLQRGVTSLSFKFCRP
ncbi:protease inhibitor I42 family protein [Brevibacillus ruminantium]|uniref:protease inhibitor I42 family protein n=1 Tax=Brevibacillus ruminantium TaxID=2950604 RepID=UPI0038990403